MMRAAIGEGGGGSQGLEAQCGSIPHQMMNGQAQKLNEKIHLSRSIDCIPDEKLVFIETKKRKKKFVG